MISDILRKLTSLLSIFFRNNQINLKKDYKILYEIRNLLKKHNINYSNLKETHKVFNKKTYLLLKKNNLKNFLRNSFIQKMFFIHNRLFIYKELKTLKQSPDWFLYKNLIKEDSIGNPIRYFLYPQSSGNKINHVFHLNLLKEEFGINLKKIKNVFEFGAGYGCMARIFSKINKDIKYLCFDTYYINLLQYYYLKHNNLDVGFNRKKNKFFLESNIKKINLFNNKKYLFIANWSLSETPIDFRKNFEKLINNSQYILICFQEKFENVNNLKYFDSLKNKISNRFNVKILKNKFYKGNLVKRQNHYFFIGKKL